MPKVKFNSLQQLTCQRVNFDCVKRLTQRAVEAEILQVSVEEFRDTTSVCCGVQRYYTCLLWSSEILQVSVEEFRDTTSVCCGVQRYYKCLLRSSEILQVSVVEFRDTTSVC